MVGGLIKAGRFSTFGCTPPRCVREMGVNLYFSGAQKITRFLHAYLQKKTSTERPKTLSSRHSASSLVGATGW